jgi:hypothetical protein
MQLSDGIEPISKQLLALHEMFRSARYDVTFSFTPEQCVEFNQFFAQLQSNYLENYGQHIVASIRRIGLISFRFAMILSALRLLERDGGLDCYHITCSDQDFRNALIITQCIIEHTAIIYSELPEPAASLTNKTPYHQALLDQIYKSLPDTFTQADIQRIATEINVSVRSARRYINQLIATNRIDKKAYNSYVKLNNV